eukprot:760467-Hanusia_phi.AAC.15
MSKDEGERENEEEGKERRHSGRHAPLQSWSACAHKQRQQCLPDHVVHEDVNTGTEGGDQREGDGRRGTADEDREGGMHHLQLGHEESAQHARLHLKVVGGAQQLLAHLEQVVKDAVEARKERSAGSWGCGWRVVIGRMKFADPLVVDLQPLQPRDNLSQHSLCAALLLTPPLLLLPVSFSSSCSSSCLGLPASSSHLSFASSNGLCGGRITIPPLLAALRTVQRLCEGPRLHQVTDCKRKEGEAGGG